MEDFDRDRFRVSPGQRRDYTSNPSRSAEPLPKPANTNLQEPPAAQIRPQKGRRSYKKHFLYMCAILLVAGAVGGAWWYFKLRNTSPVPVSIQKAVSFPVYYPDPKKLPAGYSLDLSSFKNPVNNGVNYSVDYQSGKLVFSLQPKPSGNELTTFVNNFIPLSNEVNLSIGTAKIGAYSSHGVSQTLVSVPTYTNTWIIITAPSSLGQGDLTAVLKSLTR